MPRPVYGDYDKDLKDFLCDDFDPKYSLKVKSEGPFGTTLTSTTTFKESKDSKGCCCTLVPKLSVKYPHSSGFTVEKFEVTETAKASVETSLKGLAPGLKLEFKGNDTDKADLSMQYVHESATVTSEVDIYNFKSVKTSVCTGHGDITVGASADLKLDKSSVESTNVSLGVGYKMPNVAVALRANDNISSFTARWQYDGIHNVVLGGDVNHGKDLTASVAGSYKCNPDTVVKVKIGTANGGTLYGSCKQFFPNKFTVVGSAEVPTSFSGIKFGLNATLG